MANSDESIYNPGANWFDNIWSILRDIPHSIKEVVTNQAQGLLYLGNVIGDFFVNLGESIGGFFNNLWINISDFFKDLPVNISNILSYINPFSDNFFLKIAFVMTEEQEEKHSNNQNEFDALFKSKIPFVGVLIDTFNEALERHSSISEVKTFSSSVDPLNLEIGSFNYNGGAISYTTKSTDLSFILEKYEPYRLHIRNGLMLIVYGLGIIYLVKYVLNYGTTQALSLGLHEYKTGMKGDE